MLRLEEVRKSYDGGQNYAVDGVSLSAQAGELIVLLGGSGCGKTTTLKMVNRLIEPTSGTIEVGGRDISSLEPAQLRRTIGYVIQGVGLFPHLTVGENVAVTPNLLGWDKQRIAGRVDELLELVRLPAETFRDRMPNELSGGQRQRIGFARALAAEPATMLLDEPFGALDPVTRNELQFEFKRIQKTLGFSAMFVTHDMTEALMLADRIVVMHEGVIAQSGSPAELLTTPKAGYVAELMAAPRQQAEALAALIPSSDRSQPS